MDRTIKVGVLGVGALGRHHARLYRECAGAVLTGVFDTNPAQAQKMAKTLATKAFDSAEALAEKVDALSIAVPTTCHFEVARSMLDMGRHLLIEKPITESVAQARELLELAKSRRLVLQVGHVERFNPVISYLENKVNNPRFIESHRLSPYPPPRAGLPPRGTEVSVVLDLMIHDIDMVLSLNPSEVVEVDAVGVPILSTAEDIANARIKFANGCVANLTASRVTPEPMRKIRLFQKNCYLSLDYMAKSGEIFTLENGTIQRENLPVEDHNALLKELEHFVGCIRTLNQSGVLPTPKVSGEHGLRALEVAERVGECMAAATPLSG